MDNTQASMEAMAVGPAPLAERLAKARVWLDDHLRSDPADAKRLAEMLLAQATQAGVVAGQAWLHFFLGWLALDADDFEDATDLIEQSRSTFEKLADHEGLSRCLNALGAINMALGVFDLALDFFRESVAEAEGTGRRELADPARWNMAECLYELGEPEEALDVLEQCLKETVAAPRNLATSHLQAGQIYRALGRLVEAEHELQEALRLASGSRRESLEARQALAEVHLEGQRPDQAWDLAAAGLAECTETGERLLAARFLLTRAKLALAANQADQAFPDLERALGTARELGARKIEMDAESILSSAWQTLGDHREALEALKRHAALKDTMRGEQTSRRIRRMHYDRMRQSARTFESLYRQISAVSEIGQRITASLDFEATLDTLHAAINTIMDAPTIMVATVDEAAKRLDYRLVIVRGQRREPFSDPLENDSFGCWCVNHGEDIVMGDMEVEYHQYVSSLEELLFDGLAEKSLVFIPLRVGDRVVGMLSVQSHLPWAYDKRRVETVRAIGAYLAIALENSRLFQQIQTLATLDALTGLLNRRRLTEMVEEAYLKARRYKHPAGVIMIDVDHFKQINDTCGHETGDRALQAVADVLAAKVRDCDTVGRFGGEEFLVLLPETDLEGTRALAERLREAVETREIQTPGGQSLRMTASFGVTAIHACDPGHEAVLRRADRALYRSKEDGRNRVSVEAP